MTRSLVTAPDRMPVTLADAKEHLRILHYDDDVYLYGAISLATTYAQSYCNRVFCRQTWNLYIDKFPSVGEISLPYGQLQSVIHVKYTDSNDSESTFSTDYYSVDTNSEPGRIVLNYGESWPTDTLRTNNPIEIQFICGYFAGDRWSHTTAKLSGTYVEPTTRYGNGLVYQAGGNGTTSSAEPTWPGTVSGTVVDNDITWTCVGKSVPMQIRQAILLIVADTYKSRETNIFGVTHKKLSTIESLLYPFKVAGGAV